MGDDGVMSMEDFEDIEKQEAEIDQKIIEATAKTAEIEKKIKEMQQVMR